MMSHQTKPLILVLIAFVATTMMVSVAKAQTPVPQMATPLPSEPLTPFSTPSPTPSVEERLDALESQVSDLNEKAKTSQSKEIVDIIQSLVTVIAIVVGGLCSYWLFVQNRQRYARASITHDITHVPIADDKILLHVSITVFNKGDILLPLESMETRIQCMLPPPDEVLDSIAKGHELVSEGETEYIWPSLDSRESRWKKHQREIEPNESQDIHYDFIIDAEIQVIQVYSFLENETKPGRDIGWDLTTLYDLRGTGEAPTQATRSESNGKRANTRTEGTET